MTTVTDAQNEGNALNALISSLTPANQNTVRPQIQAAALTLQSITMPTSGLCRPMLKKQALAR